MSQLAFNLAQDPALTREDFVVSRCNRAAWSLVQSWPAWPSYGLILNGPAGAGKTHLAHIWREKTGGIFLESDTAAPALERYETARPCYIIEQAETWEDEAALLHTLNRIQEQRGFALLTSHIPPLHYPYTLADLRSRLLALPAAALEAPDDALLHALLQKQFTDRQLRVSAEVIDYLVSRMERSFAAAVDVVGRVDALSLHARRNITIPLLRQLWEE